MVSYVNGLISFAVLGLVVAFAIPTRIILFGFVGAFVTILLTLLCTVNASLFWYNSSIVIRYCIYISGVSMMVASGISVISAIFSEEKYKKMYDAYSYMLYSVLLFSFYGMMAELLRSAYSLRILS